MVIQDVVFVVTVKATDLTVSLLKGAVFRCERFERSINFKGRAVITFQLSTEESYRDFPSRAVPVDVRGILMRVDITHLVEVHPRLWDSLKDEHATCSGQGRSGPNRAFQVEG
jgi:hypothetical protein